MNDVAQVLSELNENEGTNIEIEFHDNPNEIPDPSNLNKTIRNLMIFDDIMTDRNKIQLTIFILEVGQPTATVYI